MLSKWRNTLEENRKIYSIGLFIAVRGVSLSAFEDLSRRTGICFVKLIIINVLSVVFNVNYSKHLIS